MHFQISKCTERHLSLLGTLFILLNIVPGLVCVSNSGVPSSRISSRSNISKTSNATFQTTASSTALLDREHTCVEISGQVVCAATTTATYPQSLSPFSGNVSLSSRSQSSSSFSTASSSLTFFGLGNSSSHHVRGSMGTASPTVDSSPTKIGNFSLSTLSQSSTTLTKSSNTPTLEMTASPISSYSYSSKTSEITASSQDGNLLASSSFSAGTNSSAGFRGQSQPNGHIMPSLSQTTAITSSSHGGSVLTNASYLTNNSFSATTSSYSESRGQLQPNGRITPSVSQTTSTFGRFSASSSPTKTSSSNSALVSGFYETLPGGTTTYFNITTTITSPPTGFSTILASNSLWSGDTNTVIDHTTYPVLYGCAHCGGLHNGIILAGLGGTSSDPARTGCGSGILAIFRSIFGCGTEFNFPPLWDLPAIIIDPSGDPVPLASEPVPDPDPESSPDQDPDQTRQSRSDGPTISRASPTSNSLAPTSLAPISSISTQSNPIPSTSIPSASISSALNSSSLTSSVSNSSSSTSSTSISSASASSVVTCSSSATPIPHGVFLKVGLNSVELNTFSAFLKDEVGDSALVTQISTSMFAAVMNDCVASRIDTHTSVETVLPDFGVPIDFGESSDTVQEILDATNATSKKRLRKRDTVFQSGAPPDLRFISEPKGPDLSVDDTDRYDYDDSAGEGVFVYVIDSGANLDNPDYYEMEVEPQWLWPTEQVWNDLISADYSQPYESFSDESNHGSCIVSKVAGFSWGVAKKASVVVVKVLTGSTEDNQQYMDFMSVLTALSLVQNHMNDRAEAGEPVNGKAVVNMSFGIPLNPISDAYWIREFEIAVRALLLLDAIIVVAAGNFRGTPGLPDDVFAYPARLAGLWPDMIVVGSVNEYGLEFESSNNGPLVTVWAPGVNVKCAAHVGEGDQELTGTSMAAAIVSGLAAYLLALFPELQRPGTGLTARAVKSQIIALSWARENVDQDPDLVYPAAIWNGLESPLDEGSSMECSDYGSDSGSGSGSDDAKLRRRDTTSATSCVRLSSIVSSSSTATTRTTFVTSSTSSSTSTNPSEPSSTGKIYPGLQLCEESCSSGTCKSVEVDGDQRYECSQDGPTKGGID